MLPYNAIYTCCNAQSTWPRSTHPLNPTFPLLPPQINTPPSLHQCPHHCRTTALSATHFASQTPATARRPNRMSSSARGVIGELPSWNSQGRFHSVSRPASQDSASSPLRSCSQAKVLARPACFLASWPTGSPPESYIRTLLSAVAVPSVRRRAPTRSIPARESSLARRLSLVGQPPFLTALALSWARPLLLARGLTLVTAVVPRHCSVNLLQKLAQASFLSAKDFSAHRPYRYSQLLRSQSLRKYLWVCQDYAGAHRWNLRINSCFGLNFGGIAVVLSFIFLRVFYLESSYTIR